MLKETKLSNLPERMDPAQLLSHRNQEVTVDSGEKKTTMLRERK